LETGNAPAKLRIGWLRSVANIYHAFAIQSFAPELAAAAGREDPAGDTPMNRSIVHCTIQKGS
jgi:hypothetical protein